MNDLIVQCKKCGVYIHRINKRFCCGIDYHPIDIKTKERKNKSKRTLTPQKVRQAVFERDNYTCKCGEKATDIHHIIHQEDGGMHDMNNLISLCKKCHAEEHKGEMVYHALLANINE